MKVFIEDMQHSLRDVDATKRKHILIHNLFTLIQAEYKTFPKSQDTRFWKLFAKEI